MVNENEIKGWYNQRYLDDKENAWRISAAYPIFLDYLNVKPGQKLLDIGCGTGYLLKIADERGLETYGVDISEEGVKIAQKISSRSKIIETKGEELKFPDKYFDRVSCIGVLEHFLDMDKGMREMLRVGKDDALYCIVVPNDKFLFSLFSKQKGTEQQDINEVMLSLEQWKEKFVNAGFKIFAIHQDKWLMKKIRIFSSIDLGIITRSIVKLIWYFLPIKYTYQFIFIMSK